MANQPSKPPFVQVHLSMVAGHPGMMSGNISALLPTALMMELVGLIEKLRRQAEAGDIGQQPSQEDRDRICAYLMSLPPPDREAQKKLEAALGCKIEDLIRPAKPH